MAYPPPVSDNDKKLLNHLKYRYFSNPIEWHQLERELDFPPSIFLDGIAHLVAGGLISTAQARQGFLKTLAGADPDRYVFITNEGVKYLEEYGHTTAAEDAREAALNETPEDRRDAIDEAVRIFEDSFSDNPIYSEEKLTEAAARLDDDIKEEIRTAAEEERAMWDEFETRFGHRGVASSTEEAEFRDPVIIATTVRVFRAKDEQLRRLDLPASEKPPAWPTHYKNGDIGLEPAPWE
jgi:hypothetical protein